MSLNLEMDEQPAESRFFSSDDKTTGDNEGDQVNGGLDDDDVDSEGGDQKCLTLRLLQRCLPWFQTKSVWEPSQGDLFKTQVVQEVKYPAVLVLLERPFCEFVFVFSSIFSILLLLFSEGTSIPDPLILLHGTVCQPNMYKGDVCMIITIRRFSPGIPNPVGCDPLQQLCLHLLRVWCVVGDPREGQVCQDETRVQFQRHALLPPGRHPDRHRHPRDTYSERQRC